MAYICLCGVAAIWLLANSNVKNSVRRILYTLRAGKAGWTGQRSLRKEVLLNEVICDNR